MQKIYFQKTLSVIRVIHGNGANIFYSISIIHGLLYLGQLHCYVCYGNLILHYVPIFKHALLTKYQEH